MQRKIIPLAILVSCLILTALLFSFLADRRGVKEEKKAVIYMTSWGFSPKKITLTLGQTVIFENNDSAPHWPASDPHPNHKIYHEFDPHRAIPPGESWGLTFNKPGKWFFHDHFNSDFNGLIQVNDGKTDTVINNLTIKKAFAVLYRRLLAGSEHGTRTPIAKAQEIFNLCASQSPFEPCLKKQFAALSQKYDFKYVLETFRKIGDMPKYRFSCHQLAHEISRVFVEKEPLEWHKFLATAPDDCNYGFYHGTIEAYGRLSQTKIDITPEFIRKVCLETFNSSGKNSQCVHAFGHMLLVSEKGNIRKGLALCARLKDFYYEDCFHGVFMENLTKINLAEEGLADINRPIRERFSLEEVEKLCTEDPEYPADLCWKEMSHAYLFVSNFDPAFTFQACAENAPATAVESCIIHALQSIISQNENDPLRSASACSVNTDIPNFLEKCRAIIAGQTISD